MREPLISPTEIPAETLTESAFRIHAINAERSGRMFRYILEIKESLLSGKSVHFVNKDFWNNHELLLALLGITGPAHMVISTYALSETPARMIANLKDQKQLLSICAIIDNRVDTRSAGSLQLFRSLCDRISLAPCHAKVTLLYNKDFSITVVGSANYTENKRYEVGVICNDKDTLEFHKSWIDSAIKEHGQYNP